MAIQRPIFAGTIDGKNVWSYKNRLDYSLETVEERLELVKDCLNIVKEGEHEFTNDKFLVDVWDTGICKAELSKTDFLWSETNIASTLENYANYLLAMDDKNTKETYKIYTDEKKFQSALNKEKKYINTHGDELSYDDKVSFKIFIPQGNYKLDPKPSIKKSDLDKYPPLKDYQNYLDYMSAIIKSTEKKQELVDVLNSRGITQYDNEGKLWSYLVRNIGEIKKDMLKCKELLELPIKWKAPLKDSGYRNLDDFDMFDEEHVSMALKVYRDLKIVDFQNDLDCIIYDLGQLLNKCSLSIEQQEILRLWQMGYKNRDIANMLNISEVKVGRTMKMIINKIISLYEESYEDYYTLNIIKGTYKTCKECGKVKLINKFSPNGKHGYRPSCKECRNKGKK